MAQQISEQVPNPLDTRIMKTPSAVARRAFFYLQECGHLKAGGSHHTSRQNLQSFLFAVVLDGRGTLNYSGEHYQLEAGQCFFIDCRKPHFYKSSENDPWELMWVHFNGATSQKYYEYFLSQSKNVFRPGLFNKVVACINDMIRVNEECAPNAEVITSGLIVDLLTTALTVSENTGQYDSALKQKLAAVNNYIEENFSEDISLEKLASEFYISKYYLTREYKKIYGRTIFQHIITCRINYGKKLLRFSDKSVEEIAHLCGFNDQSYFARQFKKTESLTCFAYRKMWRD